MCGACLEGIRVPAFCSLLSELWEREMRGAAQAVGRGYSGGISRSCNVICWPAVVALVI